ncbi:MAG: hypothetical protein IJV44_07470 [Prevotella sp.]|nr:hypothetical protein [Prevotella sp.]
MNPIDLNRLNVRVPYSVWQVNEETYGFKTDFGVLYRIVFTPDQTIWEDGAYEFGILNENQKSSPSDKQLRETVFGIIEEFFASNPEILLYQCETGDNRQAMRDRLFLRWFSEYEHSDHYFIKVSEIIAEGISNFAAVIVQRENPDLNRIISDFDNFVGFFKQKPK